MATNEDLMREIVEIKTDLRNHIATEEPVLLEARGLIQAHGSSELVMPRVLFINAWMKRELNLLPISSGKVWASR